MVTYDEAYAAAEADYADPHAVLRAWDASRDRSRKTQQARAAGTWGVGPSDLSACQRAVWYRENPPKGYVPDEVPVAAAALGTFIHDGYTDARKLAFPWRVFNHKVTIPGTDATGTLDEWDPVLGRVTDYKTAGYYKWAKVAAGPPQGEWDQVLAYAMALMAEGHEIREVEILVINRENGQIESHLRNFEYMLGLAAVSELHAILDALDEGRELPRIRGGDTLLGPTVDTLCRDYCPAVRHCWNLDDLPEGRTPEGALYAADDEGIAAAAERYDVARAAESEAVAEKKFARALLEGVPPAIYGKFEVKWTGGKKSEEPDVFARVDTLEAELAEAWSEGRPPKTPWQLPSPTRTKVSSVNISVKPVRAAAAARPKKEIK